MRLTRWEGRDADGPRAVLIRRDNFNAAMQAALRELARCEDEKERSSDQAKILFRAIDTYGAESQEKMLLEEMSELQKEICKHWRGGKNFEEIAEEIADVLIMIEQIEMIFNCSDEVNRYRIDKIKRLERRLTEG